jgi:hypothetical protein
MVENEIDEDIDKDIHFSFPMFNEHIHHSCHLLSDQEKDQDSQSNCSSYHSFFGSLFHEKTCDGDSNNDNDTPQLQ